MSVLTSVIHPHAPAHAGASGLLHDLRARAVRYVRFRRTFNQLKALSDDQLDDLGLTRSALRQVAFQAAQASM